MGKIDIDNNIMCYIDPNNKLYYAENDFVNPKWIHIGPLCVSCAISNGKIIIIPYINTPPEKINNFIMTTPFFYITHNYKSNIWKKIINPITTLPGVKKILPLSISIDDIDIDNNNIICYCGIQYDNKTEYVLLYTNDDLFTNDSPLWRMIDNKTISSMTMNNFDIFVTEKNNFTIWKGLLVPERLIVSPGTQQERNTLFTWASAGSNIIASYVTGDNIYKNYILIDNNNKITLYQGDNKIKKINNDIDYGINIIKISNNKILCYSNNNNLYYGDALGVNDIINLQKLPFINLYSTDFSLDSLIAKISIQYNISSLYIIIGGIVIILIIFIIIILIMFRKTKKNKYRK